MLRPARQRLVAEQASMHPPPRLVLDNLRSNTQPFGLSLSKPSSQ